MVSDVPNRRTSSDRCGVVAGGERTSRRTRGGLIDVTEGKIVSRWNSVQGLELSTGIATGGSSKRAGASRLGYSVTHRGALSCSFNQKPRGCLVDDASPYGPIGRNW